MKGEKLKRGTPLVRFMSFWAEQKQRVSSKFQNIQISFQWSQKLRVVSCDCAINYNKVKCSKCLQILKVPGKCGSAANKAAARRKRRRCKNVRGHH